MYDFTKKGVSDMASSLSAEWGKAWDAIGDGGRDHVEITIDGRTLQVPVCADNCNAIVYMLRDMLISEITGEATIGNTRAAYDEQEIKFNSLESDYSMMTAEKLYSPLESAEQTLDEEKPLLEAKLYSPIFVDLWEYDYGESGLHCVHLDQAEAAPYFDEIRAAIQNHREPEESERGLMAYYDEPDKVGEKVRSMFIDIEMHDNKLWAVTSLKLTEPLTDIEYTALHDYIEGQFADGWGENFEQQNIKTDDGDINVHFWKHGEFYLDTQERFSKEQGLDLPPDAFSKTAPALSPAEAALNEPDIAESENFAALWEMLDRKLFVNLTNYFDSLQGKDSVYLLTEKSMEIAAMTGAYNYLTTIHNFHASEIDYLMQFKEPLKVVAEEFGYAAAIENRSDIMWNVFHKKEALTNGKHELVAEAVVSDSGEREQRLQNRLADNFAVYKRDMMDLSGDELFKSAAEIASVSEAFEYFSKEHGFVDSEVDFLLNFENPLEFLSDKWDVGLRNLTQTLDAIFDNKEQTLKNGGYTLVSDETTPTAPAVSTPAKAGANEPNSVIAEIRQAQAEKNTRERTAEPKDTPGKKNNEPDL